MKYFNAKILIQLSNVQYQYERRSYTFVALLADFGGFNDGIFLLTSSFMIIYSK